jgi:hypothetical protein
MTTITKLQGIAEIRQFFRSNEKPIFFISPTNFNLLSMDEYVKKLKHISFWNCLDGKHPNQFTPPDYPASRFANIHHPQWAQREVVDYNNYLLELPEVIDYIKSFGGKPVALFLMFDEQTEALCEKNGIEIWFPPASLRNQLDNKITTVRLGNLAGVPSVPNCLSKVNSYEHLRELAREHNLGYHLVIQTAFGDSGHTTFFINSKADWQKYADKIIPNAEVKIMKKIDCYSATQEACITKMGTIVAPLQTEVIGFPELTPDQGGWCGNELFSGAFTQEIRDKAWNYTIKFSEQLRKQGYRGYFDLDYLIDRTSGELYLSELNPRISGATPLTNHAAFAYTDLPMFLFHLLEFSEVEFELDVDDLNARYAHQNSLDCWSSLIIKHTKSSIESVTKAPHSGIWSMNDDGSIHYQRFDYQCSKLTSKNEAFVQRVAGVGYYCYYGGDMVRLILRDRVMTDDFELSDRAKAWVKGILSQYETQTI